MKHFYRHISLLAVCFCVGTQVFYSQTPGGVAGSGIWLKADVGVTGTASVSAWADQSGFARHVTQAAPANQPSLLSSYMNYNPALYFQGVPNGSGSASADYLNAGLQTLGVTNALSVFCVTSLDVAGIHSPAGHYDGWTRWRFLSNGMQSNKGGGGITSPINTPFIMDAINSNTLGSCYANGLSAGSATLTAGNYGSNAFLIGWAEASGRYSLLGKLSEVIVYNTDLSATQALQVRSYLAIKYGITLNQSTATNYVNTTGATVWDATTNATYKNNIAGIARDDNEALYQKQSMSSTSGSQQVLIGAGGTMAGSNAVNTNTLTDGQYLVWGDDGGSRTLTTMITGITGASFTMGATWKVQNTGSVGTVRVAWPVGITNLKLIQSSDAVFTAADVVTDMSVNTQTVNGTAYNYADVTLSNGQFFTFAGLATAPGGVIANLELWLRADNGAVTSGSNFTSWLDRSKNGFVFNGSATFPQFTSSSLNYNPGFTEIGTEAAFTKTETNYANWSLFTALKPGVTGNSANIISGAAFGVNYETCMNTNSLGVVVPGSGGLPSPLDYASSIIKVDTKPAMLSFIHSNLSNNVDIAYNYAGTKVPTSLNTLNTNRPLGIKNIGASYVGDLNDLIVYSTASMTASEKLRVESYLGLKYSITLDPASGSYLNSSAAPVYSIDATYKNQVMGIVRDDASGLIQKQSRTLDDTTRIYINTLATDNASNSGSFSSDLQSVVMGTDGKLLRSAPSTTAELPTGVGITSRIEREWKITNTSFNGTFSLDVKLNTSPITASDLRILIDDDGDFTNATLYSPTISYAGGVVTISGLSTTHIPLNATKYLTIVSLSTSTPLPIGLLAFHATAMDNSWVKLDWKTETELNNHYFTIEKSADGIGWEELARVEGAGTSTTLRTYLAADSSPYEGMSYYRLKQTDFNYKYSYSAIKTVTIDKDGKGVRMYPNPFLNVITIEGPASETNTLKVYTVTGKEVTGLTKLLSADATHVVLDGSKLSSGIYLIKTATTSQKIYKE